MEFISQFYLRIQEMLLCNANDDISVESPMEALSPEVTS